LLAPHPNDQGPHKKDEGITNPMDEVSVWKSAVVATRLVQESPEVIDVIVWLANDLGNDFTFNSELER
jgi:hypothetical protein